MSNHTYSCVYCSEFLSEDEIAYSEPLSPWENELFHICEPCYAGSMFDDEDDSYAYASIGWGTDEDYGYYGE